MLRNICLAIAAAAAAWAQAPAFEVASVKPASPDARGGIMQITPGGGVRLVNVNLRQLVALAWQMDRDRITGGAAWADNARFDITAKVQAGEDATRPATPDEMAIARKRLQALLTDRFQLRVRTETKEAPVYALVVARNGPRLKETSGGEDNLSASPGHIQAQNIKMDMLAGTLAGVVRRPVLDRTGLQGHYTFTLDWTREDPVGPADPEKAREAETVPGNRVDANIFQAVQDQLGLRLEATKGPVASMVIERAERPSAN